MTKNTEQLASSLVAHSVPFIILENRGAKYDRIKYTSKKDGKATFFDKAIFTCEGTSDEASQFLVETNVPEGTEVNEAKKLISEKTKEPVPPPFKKGDKILVIIAGMEIMKGVTTIKAKEIKKLD